MFASVTDAAVFLARAVPAKRSWRKHTVYNVITGISSFLVELRSHFVQMRRISSKLKISDDRLSLRC